MKLTFTLTILFTILLSACNAPLSASTPDPDLVATIVEQTLTAESINIQMQASQTPSPESPTEETPIMIITQTPTSTSTATQQATQTQTATETAAPSEFKTSLGEPDWADTLDNGNNFGLGTDGYQDEFTSIKIQDGGMVLSSSSTIGYRGWRMTSQSPENFYLEASIEVIDCAANDQYGLVFRAPDYSSGYGYYLTMTCDGKYNITKWDDNGIQNLFSPTQHELIKAGGGQQNQIGIYAEGNIYKVYINDQFLSETTDSGFLQNGYIGMFIAGYSPGAFTIKVKDIKLWVFN